ncbi:cupin domain-containing protein [Skermanella mucosa]|uniref:cupin domain-containing protein n=1 Tax=Skermanella mucosa TaxID=1789672 RepID=UPI00192AC81C|nr:cupin domain-containing protein [Skermanella mucosa]UEM19791.1 cupin domain-containing protein [Skermanella mucosa]
MRTALVSASILALIGAAPTAVAQTTTHQEGHTIVTPQEVPWTAAPPILPQGAEAALLYGDPSQEGPFVLRLKLPDKYHIPPHTHPKPELVTVLSGTFKLGMGEVADEAKAQSLTAGTFFGLEPGTRHFIYADEETVIEISTVGPWSLTYLNPEDDPRQQTQ